MASDAQAKAKKKKSTGPFSLWHIVLIAALFGLAGAAIGYFFRIQIFHLYYSIYEIPELKQDTWKKLHKYKGCQVPEDMMKCSEIHISDIDSPAWFHDNYKVNRWPVIIHTDNFKELGWNTANWTTDYLLQHAGEASCSSEVKLKSALLFGSAASDTRNFSSYIHDIISDDPNTAQQMHYLNLQPKSLDSQLIAPPLSWLTRDFHVPGFYLTTSLNDINFWFGRADPDKGGYSRLHVDGFDNLYALIKGKKKFAIFSPDEAYNLHYPDLVNTQKESGPFGFKMDPTFPLKPNFSPVDYPLRVDLEAYPRFSKAKKMICHLREGDFFYLPGGWFHSVGSFGVHMAINFWASVPEDSITLSAADRKKCSKILPKNFYKRKASTTTSSSSSSKKPSATQQVVDNKKGDNDEDEFGEPDEL
eukprot:m.129932 g.129932  ORF g.129932 m.129932 type:complete len:417 (-) comp23668_c0_seq1:28-1278(-)